MHFLMWSFLKKTVRLMEKTIYQKALTIDWRSELLVSFCPLKGVCFLRKSVGQQNCSRLRINVFNLSALGLIREFHGVASQAMK